MILAAIPPRFRQALYIAYAVAGPVLIYCASRGWTGEPEYALYVGVGTALGLTAAANTTAVAATVDDDSPTGAAAGPDSEQPGRTPSLARLEVIPGTTLPGVRSAPQWDGRHTRRED